MILSLLSRNYTIRNDIVFTFKYLYEGLNIPLNSKSRKNTVIDVVNHMFEEDFAYNTNINEFHRLKSYTTPKSSFLIVLDTELDQILRYNKRIDIYNLFNTFITLKKYINRESGKSYPSIDSIMNITNVVSNNSTIGYIDILEEMNMISVIRSNEYIISDKGIKRPNNQYIINDLS